MATRIININKEIANALREKSGKTEKIVGKNIPQEIRSLAAGGPANAGIYYNAVDNGGYITDITLFGKVFKLAGQLNQQNLKIVRLENVEELPAYCFYKSGAVDNIYGKAAEVYFDDKIKKWGEKCFAENSTKFYLPDGSENTIPPGVTVIPADCFYNGYQKNITWHDNITEIGMNAFVSSNITIKNEKLPDNLETIADGAFKVVSVGFNEIPAKVKTIGANVFYQNKLITELTFKGTPTSISSTAFNGMTALKTINVPWAQGAVAGAPWGATGATINYNVTV